MMHKKFFDEWLLLVSDDPRDLFLYMNKSELFGVHIENCRDENALNVMVNISPVHDKPFIFLNKKTLCELPIYKSSTLIMQSCCELVELLIDELNWEGKTKPSRFISMTAKMYAEMIMKELNFPEVYFLIEI
jgi:hypothetical protein